MSGSRARRRTPVIGYERSLGGCGTTGPGVSHYRVDADGVSAEWVEAEVATLGQPTIVYFHGSRFASGSLEKVRPQAAELAIITGARVLSVESCTVEDGLTAYVWLLREGLDRQTTIFLGPPGNGRLPSAVLLAAAALGLPLPAGSQTVSLPLALELGNSKHLDRFYEEPPAVLTARRKHQRGEGKPAPRGP